MQDTPHPKRTRGRPRGATPDKGAGTVQALDRGLTLLTALAKRDQATLTDLAYQTGMPPSSAHRVLTTLQAHGYVDFDEATNEWSVGVESFRTGASFTRRANAVDMAREVMRDLVQATGETANLAVPHGDEVVFVSQEETANPIRALFQTGTRAPMHASGIGKALLATRSQAAVETLLQRTGLPEFTRTTRTTPQALFADLALIRQRGWALDDEERYAGMRCVAAAVWDARGRAVAGLSVSGPTVRFSDLVIAEVGPQVRRAAADLTRRLGGEPHLADVA